MSRRIADIAARREAIAPQVLGPYSRKPTDDERLVFDHFGLSAKARKIATYAARRSYPNARECYRAIANSLR